MSRGLGDVYKRQTMDGAALADEALTLSPSQVSEVRTLLPRCGAGPDPVPAAELSALGLLG